MIAVIAYGVLILNITHTAISAPAREIYHRDLNEGRYEGEDPKWFKNEIRHSDPYVTIKNMEMISATAFMLPSATKTNAITIVTSEALTGSLSDRLAKESHLLILSEGNDSSCARACKVRGATIIDPKAEDIVEKASPRGMKNAPPIAIFAIMS